jgi:hypothetical protein
MFPMFVSLTKTGINHLHPVEKQKETMNFSGILNFVCCRYKAFIELCDFQISAPLNLCLLQYKASIASKFLVYYLLVNKNSVKKTALF